MAARAKTGTLTWRNWAGNQSCTPAVVERPRDVEEVVAAVKRAVGAGQRIRVRGSGHSFTAAVTTDGCMIDLERMNRVIEVDHQRRRVTAQGGIALRQLNRQLWLAGLSMSNLGDIDVQTLAGAISTGTHGTGQDFGGLATQVVGMELVSAEGAVVHCSEEERPDLFAAARVSLGALGVITAVTLQCEPAFVLRAQEGVMAIGDVVSDFDGLAAGNEHFEFYWFPHTETAMVKQNNRLAVGSAPAPLNPVRAFLEDEVLSNAAFGAVCEIGRRAPGLIPALTRRTTRLLGSRTYTGPSHQVFTSRRRVRFVEMEYSVPRPAVGDALGAIRMVIEREGLRVSFPVEVRVAKGDDIPLSTASGRDSAYLAVHMYRGTPGYERYFRAVEGELAPLGGRPHWGKLHYRSAADLAGAYPRWDAFQAVRRTLDPAGVFLNDYARRVLEG
jgi:FAD-linked oxidoreductase